MVSPSLNLGKILSDFVQKQKYTVTKNRNSIDISFGFRYHIYRLQHDSCISQVRSVIHVQ